MTPLLGPLPFPIPMLVQESVPVVHKWQIDKRPSGASWRGFGHSGQGRRKGGKLPTAITTMEQLQLKNGARTELQKRADQSVLIFPSWC